MNQLLNELIDLLGSTAALEEVTGFSITEWREVIEDAVFTNNQNLKTNTEATLHDFIRAITKETM